MFPSANSHRKLHFPIHPTIHWTRRRPDLDEARAAIIYVAELERHIKQQAKPAATR